MKKIGLVAALGAILLVSACATGGSASPNPVGTWGVSEEGKPQLVIEDGGTLHGTDGCNRLIGNWAEADGNITFSQLAGTRMFCEGVDTWLSDAASAKIVNKTLEIHNAQDAKIGTLEHQDQ
ncbi:META domain-containing protein [Arthrobacter sp. MYb227]|uniref:META domain-containing protein n=1 Tax=Arthrobacter sp. MYb227 TaxID=1848601 RepID=UPI000CFB4A1B|nr:META domain-containing protein [Arthrobacter sp. MYb227]PQZ87753.1 META domain-containing protein [Arthrobacter sp. MYb227]